GTPSRWRVRWPVTPSATRGRGASTPPRGRRSSRWCGPASPSAGRRSWQGWPSWSRWRWSRSRRPGSRCSPRRPSPSWPEPSPLPHRAARPARTTDDHDHAVDHRAPRLARQLRPEARRPPDTGALAGHPAGAAYVDARDRGAARLVGRRADVRRRLVGRRRRPRPGPRGRSRRPGPAGAVHRGGRARGGRRRRPAGARVGLRPGARPTSPRPEVALARWSLMAQFALFGVLGTSWMSRLPSIRSELGLSAGHLGSLLVVGGAGSLLAVLVAGAVVARFGSRRTLVAATAGNAVGFG